MVIKASSGKEIDALLSDLASDRPIVRDGAVARLTVIGGRAVSRLLGLGTNTAAAPSTRSAAFRALEAIADPRSLDIALEVIADDDPLVATAAARVAGALLPTPRGLVALDRLTAILLDTGRPTGVRLAVIRALADLDPATASPVFAVLRADPDPTVAQAAAAARGSGVDSSDPTRCLNDAAQGALPEDSAILRRALTQASAAAPPRLIRQVIEHVRVREGAEPASSRVGWTMARATAHATLAARGSREALYDLRETIETARDPLAVEFVAALTAVGDQSCLEPIAAAFSLATTGVQTQDDWWHRSLAEAFRAIVRREGITRRQALARRIDKRWPGAFERLVGWG